MVMMGMLIIIIKMVAVNFFMVLLPLMMSIVGKPIKLTKLITIVIKMGNNKIFKALSSSTRIQIIKVLVGRELHVSGLARELGISVPVISRHVKLLEDAGLLQKRIVGNVYLLSSTIGSLEEALTPFIDESTITIKKQNSLFDALKQIPGIEIQKVGDTQYITSINGERGYYIYEVDGIPPTIPIDKYTPTKNVTLHLKKIVPVDKKKITIYVKQKKK
jgi:DNA-binding transcriptional ArsR family regulator